MRTKLNIISYSLHQYEQITNISIVISKHHRRIYAIFYLSAYIIIYLIYSQIFFEILLNLYLYFIMKLQLLIATAFPLVHSEYIVCRLRSIYENHPTPLSVTGYFNTHAWCVIPRSWKDSSPHTHALAHAYTRFKTPKFLQIFVG